jgi:glycosyltransferase involved in cell wall biosynthesis
MHRPAVSVCIPVYNGGQFVGETIGSVLDQTFGDFEVVVLDNASTDGTAAVLDAITDPRLRRSRNSSTVPLHANFDLAVRASRAPLVKLLCADDLLHPRCLELQVDALAADPTLAMVACRQYLVDGHGRVLAASRALRGLTERCDNRRVIRRIVRSGANPIGAPGSVLFRREHFERTGGFDGRRQFTADLEMYARLLEHGDFFGMSEALAAFRVTSGTLSSRAGRDAYREQLETTRALSASEIWSLPRRDLALGRLAAPWGKWRRELVFALSRLTSKAVP